MEKHFKIVPSYKFADIAFDYYSFAFALSTFRKFPFDLLWFCLDFRCHFWFAIFLVVFSLRLSIKTFFTELAFQNYFVFFIHMIGKVFFLIKAQITFCAFLMHGVAMNP